MEQIQEEVIKLIWIFDLKQLGGIDITQLIKWMYIIHQIFQSHRSIHVYIFILRCTRVGSTNGIKSYDYGRGAPRVGQQKRVRKERKNRSKNI